MDKTIKEILKNKLNRIQDNLSINNNSKLENYFSEMLNSNSLDDYLEEFDECNENDETHQSCPIHIRSWLTIAEDLFEYKYDEKHNRLIIEFSGDIEIRLDEV